MHTLTKGVLRSIIVDYLQRSFEQEKVAIAYIYCSYKEQEDQTDANLVASLLQQLAQRNSSISNEISSLYHHHVKERTRPALGEWSQLLQSEVHHLSKVFVIVDALDECSESNGTRDSFLTEIRKLPNMHLLVTSRHILTIEREFEKAASVEIRASDEDVKRYLQDRIKKERRLVGHIKADPALGETIISTIVQKAKGMYVLGDKSG
jgi:NACHT domain